MAVVMAGAVACMNHAIGGLYLSIYLPAYLSIYLSAMGGLRDVLRTYCCWGLIQANNNERERTI